MPKCRVCGDQTTLVKPGEESLPGLQLLKPAQICPSHGLVAVDPDATESESQEK